jgi:hypothetical protein
LYALSGRRDVNEVWHRFSTGSLNHFAQQWEDLLPGEGRDEAVLVVAGSVEDQVVEAELGRWS